MYQSFTMNNRNPYFKFKLIANKFNDQIKYFISVFISLDIIHKRIKSNNKILFINAQKKKNKNIFEI